MEKPAEKRPGRPRTGLRHPIRAWHHTDAEGDALIEKLAKKCGQSRSEVIRRAIEELAAREGVET